MNNRLRTHVRYPEDADSVDSEVLETGVGGGGRGES